MAPLADCSFVSPRKTTSPFGPRPSVKASDFFRGLLTVPVRVGPTPGFRSHRYVLGHKDRLGSVVLNGLPGRVGSRLGVEGGVGLLVSQWNTARGWPYRVMQFRVTLLDTPLD